MPFLDSQNVHYHGIWCPAGLVKLKCLYVALHMQPENGFNQTERECTTFKPCCSQQLKKDSWPTS